jgi:uncharacterized repeat protein (TIGR01451 family)
MVPLPGLVAVLVLCLGIKAAEPPAFSDRPLLEISQKLPERIEGRSPFAVEMLVRNAGTEAVEGVVVTDVLPPGFELQDSSPAPARVGAQLSWAVGRLAPGEQRLFRLSLSARAPGDQTVFRHSVQVGYQAFTSSVRTVPLTRPVLDVSVGPASRLAVGTPTVLTLTVRNTGNATANEVSLQTLLSAGLTTPHGSDLETSLGALAPGQSRSIPLEVTAVREGEAVVRVTAQSESAEPCVREFRLSAETVRLILTGHGPATLPEQFAGLFELHVRNDQTETVPEVSLTLTLPPGLAFVRASDLGVYDASTHSVRWNLCDLRPGEQRSVAWNATAVKPGDQAWQAQLRVGQRTYPEVHCSTRVLPATSPPAPAQRPP